MAIMDYIVPIVGGFFILLFLSIFGWLFYKFMWKPTLGKALKNMRLKRRKAKILGDEKVIEYCIARIEAGWSDAQVKEELLLANKYSMQKIEEMVYAYNEVKKTMTEEEKKAVDLP